MIKKKKLRLIVGPLHVLAVDLWQIEHWDLRDGPAVVGASYLELNH